MKINQWFAVTSIAAAVCLGASLGLAQDNGGGGGGGGGRQRGGGFGGGGGGGGGNFDPAQFQQRRLERIHEQLEITNDDEWKALEPLITKVMDAQREAFQGMGRGGFRGRGGQGGGGDNGGGGGGGRGGFGGQPSPEQDSLQKAVDGKASNSELKAAIAKYAASRKEKQAALEKAQADLKKVLSVRQEAIATLNGLL